MMNASMTLCSPMGVWLETFRLRTLSLAFVSIFTGSGIAYWQGSFKMDVAVLALLTAALLQILSNLANDYGDYKKGADAVNRIGPQRGLQRGLITPLQMRRALYLTIFLALAAGLALVLVSVRTPHDVLVFLMLGVLSIAAAITYTVGSRPYGYRGLGDASVFLFFGWVGVMGSNYLQAGHFDMAVILPATACGLLAAAVLNVNNMRDIDSDRTHGKNTLAVKLGPIRARIYHACILIAALICLMSFLLIEGSTRSAWVFIVAIPPVLWQIRFIVNERAPANMRPMLGKTVAMALFVNVIFIASLMVR
jgi:1,4-dihydroxy-2-naphthoate octaprenyltransferase